MIRISFHRLFAIFGCALLLSACGDGGSGGTSGTSSSSVSLPSSIAGLVVDLTYGSLELERRG